jgi:autotransporter translocation and assembly factor TamB
MRAGWKLLLLRIGAAAAALLALLALGVWFLLSTGWGHAATARLIAALSGGGVTIEGLSGDLPDKLAVARLEIADRKGVWLRAANVSLDWHALALFKSRVEIGRLQAQEVALLRRPLAAAESKGRDYVVTVARLDIARLVLGKTVLGHAAILRASGSLHYGAVDDMAAKLSLDRLDGSGSYRIAMSIAADKLRGTAAIAETGAGLIGGLVGLPDIGPVHLDLRAAEQGGGNTVALQLAAGALQAHLQGRLDLRARRIDGEFALTAPQMRPRPDLAWKSLQAQGRISGSFSRPAIAAALQAGEVSLGENAIAAIALRADGRNGHARLSGEIAGLRLKGDGGALALSPVRLSADADLATKALRLAAAQTLFSLQGEWRQESGGNFNLNLPDLSKLSALLGSEVSGSARFALKFKPAGQQTAARLDGEIAASGNNLVAGLLGRHATVAMSGSLDSETWTLSGALQGAAIAVKIQGGTKRGRNDYLADVAVADASRLAAALSGKFSLRAHLSGERDDLKLTAEGSGNAGVKGFARDRFDFNLAVAGLPAHPAGELHLSGRLAGAPLLLDATAQKAGGGAFKAVLKRAQWKSLRADGEVLVASARSRRGQADLRVGTLADLEPFLAQNLGGRLHGHMTLLPDGQADVRVQVQDFSSAALQVAQAGLDGRVAELFAAPRLNLKLTAAGIAVRGLSASAKAEIAGPLAALRVGLSAQLVTASGPVALEAQAKADVPGRQMTVERFKLGWSGQTVALASPATLSLSGNAAVIHAHFQGGNGDALALDGSVPLSGGAFDLQIKGGAEIGGWTSLLSAEGRMLHGKLSLDAALHGPSGKLAVFGKASLHNGQYHDFSAGIGLQKIEAELTADGGVIRLAAFSARAGSGSIAGSGTLGLDGGMPVSLAFEAAKAQPFSRDGISVVLGGKADLHGSLKGDLAVEGTLRLDRGDIRLPDKLPAAIAVLDVRRPHVAPPSPRKPGRIGLNLRLVSPGRFFVRGRGLEAELQGALKITGTADSPQLQGVLSMRRGSYSLAGTSLEFQSGSIRFNGANTLGKLDPALDFTAQTSANGVSATLKIEGTLSAPKVTLSSSPSLPQDEIVSRLLFQQSAQQLSPLQLAQIAQALAALSNIGPGIDPVGMVRSGLGLDRLSIGSTATTGEGKSDTTVEAGKYLLRNVYVGAKQNLSGGTRAQVQIDLSRHFKLQASAAAGAPASATASTQDQDNGDTVGLSYQFDY